MSRITSFKLSLGLTVASLLVPAAAFAQASASDFTYATRYDSMRRVTGTIAPDPDGDGPLGHQAVRNTYNTAGWLVSVETGELYGWQSETIAPASWSGFTVNSRIDTEYDVLGRKTAERTTGSDGVTRTLTQFSYNNQGLLGCTAVRMEPSQFGARPDACTQGQGRVGSDTPDRITRNSYDDAGQLTLVEKGVGTPLRQDHVAYRYTPSGKRERVTDANGNVATMTYDGHDRLERWYFPSKTTPGQVDGNDYEAYGYDASGNRTSWRRRDGRTLTYGFDALNRMTSKIIPDGPAPNQIGGPPPNAALRDVYYGYDLRGLQTFARFDWPGGEGVTTDYDGFGAVSSSTTSLAGTVRTIASQYDADGNRRQVSAPGGSWSYAYDSADRLSALTEDWTGAVLSSWGYNARGLKANVTHLFGSGTAWQYDPLGRLSQQVETIGGGGVTLGFGYNAAGQIASLSRSNDAYVRSPGTSGTQGYRVNGQNQYEEVGGLGHLYDATGNLIANGVTAYAYDAENRLVLTSTGARLDYDPLGRLFQVTPGSGRGWTQFLYDGDQLAAEYDAGGLSASYVHGPGDDDPILSYERGIGARWYHADHQGSVIARSTGPSGGLVGMNTYDEYGVPGSGNTGRFQYTGQAWLPEIGLYHYKARVYSPTLGRFLQTDPVGYDDQINLYAYVGNDPVNGRDPTGLENEDEYRFSLGGVTLSASSQGVSISASGGGGNVTIAATDSSIGMSASGGGGDVRIAATNSGITASASGGGSRINIGATNSSVPGSLVTRAGTALAAQIGTNRVSAMTPSGRMSIDLAGKPHFDKATGREISTPHVKFQQLNTAPNGRTNLSPGTTRPATMTDVRIAREIEKRREDH